MISHHIIEHPLLGFVETWAVVDNATGEVLSERRIAWKLTMPSELIKLLRETIIKEVEKIDGIPENSKKRWAGKLDEAETSILMEDMAFTVLLVKEGVIYETTNPPRPRRKR